MSTLFEQIGGKKAVQAAVDLFYQKVLADDLIKRYFETTDMNAQRGKQILFLTYAFGGAPSYTEKSMREAHAKFVKDGLNDEHFDAVLGHLGDTLKQLNVPDHLIGEAAKIAESTRSDVLGR